MRITSFVASVVITLSIQAVAAAQTKPLPPPPAAKATLYESKEGGFKANFPSAPTVKAEEIDGSFGKTKISNHFLATTLAYYSVMHMDFPTVIKDKFDLDSRFDAVRNQQATMMKGKVTEDNELSYGDYFGRQFVIESPAATLTVRAIMVKQRMYILMMIVNGVLSKQTPNLKNLNSARIAKFLDSFEVTQIPEAAMTPVELPADFGLEVTETKFYSKFFDLSLDLPNGWFLLDKEENAMLLEIGKDSFLRSKPNASESLSLQTSRFLTVVSKNKIDTGINSATFLIGAERVAYPNFLPLSVAKSFLSMFIEKGEKVVKQPTVEKFGGLEFAWTETYNPATKIFQRMYFANRKGIALEFAISYIDPKDLETILQSVRSLKVDISKTGK